jgi:ABC-type oligopeptide transport system substrate-binding subunit
MRNVFFAILALATLGSALAGPAQAGCSIVYNPKGKVCTYTTMFPTLHAHAYRR